VFIEYTRHARRRMKWRKISESEVELTVSAPDNVEPTEKKRYNAYKTIKGKILKVTYRKTDNRRQIITALWKGE
jgi:Domain of unknown function (DUF4258)